MTVQSSQDSMFKFDETTMILSDWRGNEFQLSLATLVELVEFITPICEEHQQSFSEFLEAEYKDWAEDARQWRNFAETGDPDVSSEDYYKADRDID